MPRLSQVLMLNLDPFWNNVVVSQLMVVWYKIGLEFLYHQKLNQRVVRSLLAFFLASGLLFWPLFDTSEDTWSWRLNTVVPLSLLGRLVYKAVILKDPEDIEVQSFSRSGAVPSELLLGPLQWMVCLIYLGLNNFMQAKAAVTTAAIFFGDSCIAPLLGEFFGRHHYQMPLALRKTMEGSLVGVFVGTCVGSYILLTLMGLEIPPLRVMLVYGALAAVAEGTAPSHCDNFATFLILQASWERVPQWLQSNGTYATSDISVVSGSN